MALGIEPLGESPLGLDASYETDVVPVRQVSALKFDGTTKDFVNDADCQFEFVHPVDQAMFNICRIYVSSVRSSSDTGNNLAGARYIDKRTIQSTVDQEIERRTRHLTSTGEVTLLGNEVDVSVRGRLAFRVNYMNNITKKRGKVDA